MKKKRLIKLICSLCLMCFATLTFSACSASNPVSSTEEGAGYVPGGGPESAPGATPPGGGSSDSNVDIGEDGSLGADMTVDFSQYFKGYTVLTNGNNAYTVKDENGNDVLFNDLLDRQLDYFVQDVVFRLTFIYGSSDSAGHSLRGDTKYVDGYTIQTGASFDTDYSYNSKLANIYKEELVKTLDTSVPADVDVTSIDLNDSEAALEEFQKSFITTGTNYLNSNAGIMLVGAITGHNTEVAVELGTITFGQTSKKWEMNPAVGSSNYDVFLAQFKNPIKLALAKIMGADVSAVEYSKDLLGTINELGMLSKYEEVIVQYILDDVIGSDRVTEDNSYYEAWKTTYSGLINSTNLTTINTKPTAAEMSPKLYKGYELIVPAIVKQALAVTFADTETSIYPHFSRVNGAIGTFETVETPSKDQNGEDTIVQNLTTTGALNLNSIILMPQQGAQPISLGLQIDVARAKSNDYPAGLSVGDPGYVNYFVRDIVVELEVDITYKVGSTLVNISKAVADESKGSSIITLDSRTGYIMKQLDYNDPNFDPNKAANDEAYKEQFMKPVPNPDGQILPYDFTYSLYEHFENETVPPLDEYTGYNPLTDTNTLWDNKFVKDSVNNMIYLDAGPSYIQINFNIVSVKKYGGDNNSQLTEYFGNDVVFDITVKPYT